MTRKFGHLGGRDHPRRKSKKGRSLGGGGSLDMADQIKSIIMGYGAKKLASDGQWSITVYTSDLPDRVKGDIGESLKSDPTILNALRESGVGNVARDCLIYVLNPTERVELEARETLPREWISIVHKLLTLCTVTPGDADDQLTIKKCADYEHRAMELVGDDLRRINIDAARRRIARSPLLQLLGIEPVSNQDSPTISSQPTPEDTAEETSHTSELPVEAATPSLDDLFQPIDVGVASVEPPAPRVPDPSPETGGENIVGVQQLDPALAAEPVQRAPSHSELVEVYLRLANLQSPYLEVMRYTAERSEVIAAGGQIGLIRPVGLYEDKQVQREIAELFRHLDPAQLTMDFYDVPEVFDQTLAALYLNVMPRAVKNQVEPPDRWLMLKRFPRRYLPIARELIRHWKFIDHDDRIEVKYAMSYPQVALDLLRPMMSEIPRDEMIADVAMYPDLEEMHFARVYANVMYPDLNKFVAPSTLDESPKVSIMPLDTLEATMEPKIFFQNPKVRLFADAVAVDSAELEDEIRPVLQEAIGTLPVQQMRDLLEVYAELPDAPLHEDSAIHRLDHLARESAEGDAGAEAKAMRAFIEKLSSQMTQTATTIYHQLKDIWSPPERRVPDLQVADLLTDNELNLEQVKNEMGDGIVEDLNQRLTAALTLWEAVCQPAVTLRSGEPVPLLLNTVLTPVVTSVISTLMQDYILSQYPVLRSSFIQSASKVENETTRARCMELHQHIAKLMIDHMIALQHRIEPDEESKGSDPDFNLKRSDAVIIYSIGSQMMHAINMETYATNQNLAPVEKKATIKPEDLGEGMQYLVKFDSLIHNVDRMPKDYKLKEKIEIRDRVIGSVQVGTLNSLIRDHVTLQLIEEDKDSSETSLIPVIRSRGTTAIHYAGGRVCFPGNLVPLEEINGLSPRVRDSINHLQNQTALQLDFRDFMLEGDVIAKGSSFEQALALRTKKDKFTTILAGMDYRESAKYEMISFAMLTDDQLDCMRTKDDTEIPQFDEVGRILDEFFLIDGEGDAKLTPIPIPHLCDDKFFENEGQKEVVSTSVLAQTIKKAHWTIDDAYDFLEAAGFTGDRGSKHPGVTPKDGGPFHPLPGKRQAKDGFTHGSTLWGVLESKSKFVDWEGAVDWIIEHKWGDIPAEIRRELEALEEDAGIDD